MTLRRCTVLLALLSLTACGSKEEAEQKEAPPQSDLALPITAPMKARDRLLHDSNKAKDAAREREKQFESLINK